MHGAAGNCRLFRLPKSPNTTEKFGDMEALHVIFKLAELHAAASEPCQVTAAQLGDTRTIDPLDELLIVLGELAAAFVAAID